MNAEKKLQVLLVEDSDSDAELIVENILSSGIGNIDISIVQTLGQAIDYLENNHADAVLLDLSLPDSNGIDTVRNLMHAYSDMPTVVLTGIDDEITGVMAVRMGIQDYLVKGQADGRLIARAVRYSIERKRMEKELHRLNRTLRALSNSSQAMLRVVNESSFLEEVCRIVVEDCGHAMVWIGYAEDDEYKSVRPVAYSGFEAGYLEKLNITWADTERGRGPTGTAIRTGRPSFCLNILTDPNFAPWCEEAKERGHASSIVLPLIADGKTFGALNIYSREPDSFSGEEAELLTELAGDLTYGITAIRLRTANMKAEAALRESENHYRELFNTMTEGVMLHEMIYDNLYGVPVNYIIVSANPAVEAHLGIPLHKIIGKNALELFGTGHAPYLDIYERASSTGESALFETYFAPMNKYFSVSVFSPSHGQFATVFKDITDEKIAGMKLEQLVAERTVELSNINESLKEEVLRRGVLEMEKEKAYEELDLIFNSTDVGMMLIDVDCIVMRVNKRFIDLFSLDKEEVIGEKCYDLMHLEMCNSENCTIEKLKAGKKDVVFEMTYYSSDGVEIICQASAVPFYSHSGEMIGILKNFVDITEKREIQKRLISIIDDERKRISHDLHDELGQNLTALGFLVESVRQKLSVESEEFAPRLSEIANLVQISQRQTRTMSRVLSPVEIDRNGLITSIETMVDNVKQIYGLDCTLSIEGDCTIDDNAVATNLYYIIRESVNNSLKHGHPTTIAIRLRSNEDLMEIEVYDNGPGMTSEASGGGMGLKIMKYRAEIIGAVFNYGNYDGRGFSISVRLPK
jgi:PAS domain S-box-containing protein